MLSVPYSPPSLYAASQSNTGLKVSKTFFFFSPNVLLMGITLKILIWLLLYTVYRSTDGAVENVLCVKLRLFMFDDN